MKSTAVSLVLCCAVMLCGCASKSPSRGIVSPEDVNPPRPISGNTGQYMCPYMNDGHLAGWVRTALTAAPENRVSPSSHPSLPTAELPSQARMQARDAERQQIVAARAGGFDAIQRGSELSFSSADDLCLYLYAKYSRQADYSQIFDYVGELYPDMRHRCSEAIHKAAGGKGERHGPGGGDRGGMGGGFGGGPGGPEGMGGGPGGGMGDGRGGDVIIY